MLFLTYPMETNDGFTFKRRTNNRATIRIAELPKEDFTFNIIKENETTKSKNTKRRTSKNEETPKFSVVKKRKTIKLDNTIDISSETINDSVFQIGDHQVKKDNKNKGTKSKGKGTKIATASITAKVNNEADDTIPNIMNIPVMKEKIKSDEIHLRIKNGNINDLIKECLAFLKDGSKYSKEIERHCNSSYFSDIDYRKEIENLGTKIEQIRGEKKVWEEVYSRIKSIEEITVEDITDGDNINNDKIGESEVENVINVQSANCKIYSQNDCVKNEFMEKSKRLLLLNRKLNYFFENAKEKSENLLRCIFGILEEKNVDAIFLLKAMGKLGR